MNPRLRFTLQTLAFLGLTAAGAWWAYQRGGVVPEDLQPLRELPARYWAWIALLSIGLYVSDAWRYVTTGRAIDVPVSWTTAMHASIACNFFSCLTPGAAFGAPASIVMLARSGLSWEVSTIIGFAKSTVGSAMLQACAFLFLMLGLGPVLPRGITGLLLWGSGISAFGLGFTLIAGMYPAPVQAASRRLTAYLEANPERADTVVGRLSQRLMKGLVEAVERLQAFRPSRIPEVVLSQLVYFGCFVGLAVVLGTALGATPTKEMWGVSTVYVAFLYVAPTPGGAGLAEGTAQDFFGALLAPAAAALTVILFRTLTFYLYVLVGMAHVMWVGGVGSVLAEVEAGGRGVSDVLGRFDDHAFRRDGFAVVRGLWEPEEVRSAAAAFDGLLSEAEALADRGKSGHIDLRGSRMVLGRDPFALRRVVWCGAAAPSLARFGPDERFVSLAAHVLGARPIVQLIQQAHYKLPGDGVDFAWHQDASNRRYGTERFTDVNGRGSFVQIVVAVDPMTEANGPLRMLPGSHQQGFVADLDTGDIPEEARAGEPVSVELAPGDAAVFGPFVVHGSGPNRSDRPRRVFLQGYTLPGANRRVYPGCGVGVLRR